MDCQCLSEDKTGHPYHKWGLFNLLVFKHERDGMEIKETLCLRFWASRDDYLDYPELESSKGGTFLDTQGKGDLGLEDGIAHHGNGCFRLCVCMCVCERVRVIVRAHVVMEARRRNTLIHCEQNGEEWGCGARILTSTCYLDPFGCGILCLSLDFCVNSLICKMKIDIVPVS